MATPSDINGRIDALIEREGDYVNHPADRGGPTRWGITEAVARADGYTGDIRSLPRLRAASIYQRLYWDRPGLNEIVKRYSDVAAELFDIAANMGPTVGIGFLQRCLNAFNDGGRLYADIIVDGRSGASTLKALDGYYDVRGRPGGDALLSAIRSLRGERYIAICEARPANEAFAYGWIGRMVEMAKAAFRKGGAAAALLAILPLVACSPMQTRPTPLIVQRASAAVDRLVLLNAAAQRAVAIFRPWLAPERAARVDAIALQVDHAIAAVAAARDLAAQDEAIGAAETLIAEMKWIAGA